MNIISEKSDEKVLATGNGKFNYIWTVTDIGRSVRPWERTWTMPAPKVWKVTSMMGVTAAENPEIMTTLQVMYDVEGRRDTIRIQSFGGERIKKYEYDFSKLVIVEETNVELIDGKCAYIEGEAIVKDRVIFENKIYLWDEKRKAFFSLEGQPCPNPMLSQPELLPKFYTRIDEIERMVNDQERKKQELEQYRQNQQMQNNGQFAQNGPGMENQQFEQNGIGMENQQFGPNGPMPDNGGNNNFI